MSIRAALAKAALAALALWLGLWPAADAITGASNTLLDLSPPAAAALARCGAVTQALPACAGEAACGRMLEAKPVAGTCGAAHADCAARPAREADAGPACAGEKAARCGQCQCVSGLVLFAVAPPQFGPDLELVGTLCAASFDGASRRPRPLLRPPVAALPPSA